MMAAALPGVAVADEAKRPVSSNTVSGAASLYSDDFSMVYGTPDVPNA